MHYPFGFTAQFTSIVVRPHLWDGGPPSKANPTFVLALSTYSGVGVYHAQPRLSDDLLLVWECRYSIRSLGHPYQPKLSDTGTMITWITVPRLMFSHGASFCLAQLPFSASKGSIPPCGRRHQSPCRSMKYRLPNFLPYIGGLVGMLPK